MRLIFLVSILLVIVNCKEQDIPVIRSTDPHAEVIKDFLSAQERFKNSIATIRDVASYDQAVPELNAIVDLLHNVACRLGKLKHLPETRQLQLARTLLEGTLQTEPVSKDMLRILTIEDRRAEFGAWLDRYISAGESLGDPIRSHYLGGDLKKLWDVIECIAAGNPRKFTETGDGSFQFGWMQSHFYPRVTQNAEATFHAMVLLCCHYPKLSCRFDSLISFRASTAEEHLNARQRIEPLDRYAFDAFSRHFSEPVLIGEWETGGPKLLERYWKTPDGYLVLNSGIDIDRSCTVFFMSELPSKAQLKPSILKTVTPEFLEMDRLHPHAEKGIPPNDR
jgi:hypothetical protein